MFRFITTLFCLCLIVVGGLLALAFDIVMFFVRLVLAILITIFTLGFFTIDRYKHRNPND